MRKRRKPGPASWEGTLADIRTRRPERHTPEASERRFGQDARLGDFVSACNLQLPPTYREFTTRFGPGSLSGGWCEFYSCAAGVDLRWDMFYWNLMHARHVIDNEKADERARRVVIFGAIRDGNPYGWDPQENTRKQSREYAIYEVARFQDGTTKLAQTFPEFIRRFCLGDGLYEHLTLDADCRQDARTRSEFAPAFQPSPRWLSAVGLNWTAQ